MTKHREPYPSEKQERFIVRFPDGMRDRIREAAEANNRSMNAEIIHRLNESFLSEEAGTGNLDEIEPSSWAKHLAQPGNQKELELLLKNLLNIIKRSSE